MVHTSASEHHRCEFNARKKREFMLVVGAMNWHVDFKNDCKLSWLDDKKKKNSTDSTMSYSRHKISSDCSSPIRAISKNTYWFEANTHDEKKRKKTSETA